ncbi:MAG: hypothetical protein EXS63_00135 [Candidatus Omnitrophica bacterium]|nr:hypothetical protein [Candidatus Omnitrophota bacterium]
MRAKRRIIILAVLMGLLPCLGYAQKTKSHIHPEILSSVKAFAPGKPFTVGIHFTMDPDWHIYWINPGDSGLATSVKWVGHPPINFSPLEWPAPEKIILPAILTYGYSKEVVLLSEATVTPSFSGKSITLKADVAWLACHDLCVPGKARIVREIPAAKGKAVRNSQEIRTIERYQARVPQDYQGWEISARYSDQFALIHFKPNHEFPIKSIYFFPENSDFFKHEAGEKFRSNQAGFEVLLRRSKIFTGDLEKLEGVLAIDTGSAMVYDQVRLKPEKSGIQEF